MRMLPVLRWTARIGSVVVAVIFGLLWYRQPPYFHALSALTIAQLVLISVAVLGLLVGWWKERLGGLVALAGLLGSLLLDVIASGKLPVLPALFAMMLPALLYLLVSRARPESAR